VLGLVVRVLLKMILMVPARVTLPWLTMESYVTPMAGPWISMFITVVGCMVRLATLSRPGEKPGATVAFFDSITRYGTKPVPFRAEALPEKLHQPYLAEDITVVSLVQPV